MDHISRVDERRSILAAMSPVIEVEARYKPEIDRISARHRQAIDEAAEAMSDAERLLDEALAARNDELSEPRRMMIEDMASIPRGDYGDSVMLGDDGLPVRCAVSGLPLFHTDRLLIDNRSGTAVLREAVFPGGSAED